MPKEPAHPELSEAELTMAKTLVNSMVQEFEPEKYHDEYQARLRQIIEAKISGQEITQGAQEEPSKHHQYYGGAAGQFKTGGRQQKAA